MNETKLVVSLLDDMIAWLEAMSQQEWKDWIALNEAEAFVESFMKLEHWLNISSTPE